MRIIPTKVHGILDYVVSILLIISPWLFNFNNNKAETILPIVLGGSAIIYSLLTDYELGVSKLINIKTHLLIDLMSGILLAASPWLFGFSNRVYIPHVVFGILEIGVS